MNNQKTNLKNTNNNTSNLDNNNSESNTNQDNRNNNNSDTLKNPYENNTYELQTNTIKIVKASTELANKLCNESIVELDEEQKQRLTNKWIKSIEHHEEMDKVVDELEDTRGSSTNAPFIEKALMDIENETCAKFSACVEDSDKIVKEKDSSNISTSYNRAVSKIKTLLSDRQDLANEHSKYLEFEMKKIQDWEEKSESNKRKREEEENNDNNKKQKTEDKKDLMDEYANTSLEPADWTSGDD